MTDARLKHYGLAPLLRSGLECPRLVRRDISLQRGTSVAWGAKRTSTGGQDRPDRSLMTLIEHATSRRALE